MSATVAHRPRQSARSFQSATSSVGDKSTSTPSKTVSKPTSLSRRLLFPSLSPDLDLPPLLIAPSASPELNAELYDFIAIALRAYVNTWWSKLTRYDKELLPQINHVLTSVLRSFEARLTTIDLSPLFFRDLPTVLTQHIIDFRNAQSKLGSSYAAGGAASLPQLFHQMQPHMAVAIDGTVSEEYIRQSVDHILKISLPEEDYQPEPERYIIREVVVDVVLGVIPRISQPWFIHKVILDLLGPEEHHKLSGGRLETIPENTEPSHSSQQRTGFPKISFQSIVIFVLSAIRSISSICLALMHAYKQTIGTIKKVNETDGLFPPPISTPEPSFGGSEIEDDGASLKSTLPGTLTPTTPGMERQPSNSSTRTSSTSSNPSISQTSQPPQPPPPPNYTYPILQLFTTILSPPSPKSLNDNTARYSNLLSTALTHVLSMITMLLSPFLSRLLPYLLYTHVLSAPTIAQLVRTSRRALFPEGWPSPPPVDPTPEEQLEIKATVLRRLEAQIPSAILPLFGPTAAARSYTVSTMLDTISSQPCNAHLLLITLDLLIVTVFPELAVNEDVVVEKKRRRDSKPTRHSARSSSISS